MSLPSKSQRENVQSEKIIPIIISPDKINRIMKSKTKNNLMRSGAVSRTALSGFNMEAALYLDDNIPNFDALPTVEKNEFIYIATDICYMFGTMLGQNQYRYTWTDDPDQGLTWVPDGDNPCDLRLNVVILNSGAFTSSTRMGYMSMPSEPDNGTSIPATFTIAINDFYVTEMLSGGCTFNNGPTYSADGYTVDVTNLFLRAMKMVLFGMGIRQTRTDLVGNGFDDFITGSGTELFYTETSSSSAAVSEYRKFAALMLKTWHSGIDTSPNMDYMTNIPIDDSYDADCWEEGYPHSSYARTAVGTNGPYYLPSLEYEIKSGFTDPDSWLSSVTLGVLQDLGYAVDVSQTNSPYVLRPDVPSDISTLSTIFAANSYSTTQTKSNLNLVAVASGNNSVCWNDNVLPKVCYEGTAVPMAGVWGIAPSYSGGATMNPNTSQNGNPFTIEQSPATIRESIPLKYTKSNHPLDFFYQDVADMNITVINSITISTTTPVKLLESSGTSEYSGSTIPVPNTADIKVLLQSDLLSAFLVASQGSYGDLSYSVVVKDADGGSLFSTITDSNMFTRSTQAGLVGIVWSPGTVVATSQTVQIEVSYTLGGVTKQSASIVQIEFVTSAPPVVLPNDPLIVNPTIVSGVLPIPSSTPEGTTISSELFASLPPSTIQNGRIASTKKPASRAPVKRDGPLLDQNSTVIDMFNAKMLKCVSHDVRCVQPVSEGNVPVFVDVEYYAPSTTVLPRLVYSAPAITADTVDAVSSPESVMLGRYLVTLEYQQVEPGTSTQAQYDDGNGNMLDALNLVLPIEVEILPDGTHIKELVPKFTTSDSTIVPPALFLNPKLPNAKRLGDLLPAGGLSSIASEPFYVLAKGAAPTMNAPVDCLISYKPNEELRISLPPNIVTLPNPIRPIHISIGVSAYLESGSDQCKTISGVWDGIEPFVLTTAPVAVTTANTANVMMLQPPLFTPATPLLGATKIPPYLPGQSESVNFFLRICSVQSPDLPRSAPIATTSWNRGELMTVPPAVPPSDPAYAATQAAIVLATTTNTLISQSVPQQRYFQFHLVLNKGKILAPIPPQLKLKTSSRKFVIRVAQSTAPTTTEILDTTKLTSFISTSAMKYALFRDLALSIGVSEHYLRLDSLVAAEVPAKPFGWSLIPATNTVTTGGAAAGKFGVLVVSVSFAFPRSKFVFARHQLLYKTFNFPNMTYQYPIDLAKSTTSVTQALPIIIEEMRPGKPPK
jgi:hypothetical protein